MRYFLKTNPGVSISKGYDTTKDPTPPCVHNQNSLASQQN